MQITNIKMTCVLYTPVLLQMCLCIQASSDLDDKSLIKEYVIYGESELLPTCSAASRHQGALLVTECFARRSSRLPFFLVSMESGGSSLPCMSCLVTNITPGGFSPGYVTFHHHTCGIWFCLQWISSAMCKKDGSTSSFSLFQPFNMAQQLWIHVVCVWYFLSAMIEVQHQ